MKISFFPKLAWSGMRKNRKLYLPYLLTCIGMVMMYYILSFLAYSDLLIHMRGAGTLRSMMQMGSQVVMIFVVLFLLYSNSFLVRRRQKEFGLYHILGMGKGGISLVLFWEVLTTSVISLVLGLMMGMLFSKAAEAMMVNMLNGTVTYTLSISGEAVKQTIILFAIVFALIFLRSIWLLRKTNAINLLRSENVGEKPPKANWLLGIGGVVLLIAAYYIAISIESPLAAFATFFGAVAMVILATYLIFGAGSVLLCRILQRNKRYYYKANHFVAVSSMAYRMNRTGAGLASVCILLTMVLVMISSTSCLFFGEETALSSRYPRQINIDVHYRDDKLVEEAKQESVRRMVSDILQDQQVEIENVLDYRAYITSGLLTGSTVNIELSDGMLITTLTDYDSLRNFCFVPLEDYNRLMGTNETLEDGEALMYTLRQAYTEDMISFEQGSSFKIKQHIKEFAASGRTSMDVVDTMYLIVPDMETSIAPFTEDLLNMRWTYAFDPVLDSEQILALYQQIDEQLDDVPGINIECREYNRSDFYGTFGGFFFLGLMLSTVFIFAAILIIYYKQLSEGYEDQSRFEIMQKVGMTKKDIRRCINSQMLTVFFMPLLMAGLHMLFAFPMVNKLLVLFNMSNIGLFAVTTLISFAIFGVLYVIVYKITSMAYYDIVSGARKKEA